MRMTGDEFRHWANKSVTLLGMSGIGKTFTSTRLRRENWFHYSADYRIGTRYLSEPILDNIKRQAMQVPFLRDLLRSDSIFISNNITVDNLTAVLSFLGKLGNPDLNGHDLSEFRRRQDLYRDAEIHTMLDVPEFINKAREIYGYRHFVNDSAGSLCEIASDDVMSVLAEHTVIVYIEADDSMVRELNARAKANPKPLFYPEAFLEQYLQQYLQENGLSDASQIVPDEFVVWTFPRLYDDRIPRYRRIAVEYGYTVSATEIAQVTNEKQFIDCIARVLDR